MNKSAMRKLMVVIFLSVFLVFGIDLHRARGGLGWGGGPQVVSLEGTFYPLEDNKQAASLHILNVWVNQKEWLFKVNKARDLRGNLDLPLLHYISPPPF